METGDIIVKLGHVESTYDESFGLRIKARLEEDGGIKDSDLPFAFPLLPKTFQTIPKVGELVLIFTARSGQEKSQRYYIGPIISQPQYQDECRYDYGRGPALSLIKGGTVEPLETIKNYRETQGAYPNDNNAFFRDDVAVVGRTTQDIIMRHNDRKNTDEVDIRCGIREKSPYTKVDDISKVGNIIFNSTDPAYIQLKYKKSLTQGHKTAANSIINIVADKINIVSNKDDNQFNLGDSDELIKTEELQGIMDKLHRVPLGDVLSELIVKMNTAFQTHTHKHNQLPPTYANDVKELDEYVTNNLDEILSDHVRIS